ncbi:hypothetical protein ACFRFQ_14055 [Rhodococcus sp. NPDC056743]
MDGGISGGFVKRAARSTGVRGVAQFASQGLDSYAVQSRRLTVPINFER